MIHQIKLLIEIEAEAEIALQHIPPWVSVDDRLPELTEPFMAYNDQGVREVWFENDHIIVLGYNPKIGIFKAKLDRHTGWSEVSTLSINGTIKPTHWMPLPELPKVESA